MRSTYLFSSLQSHTVKYHKWPVSTTHKKDHWGGIYYLITFLICQSLQNQSHVTTESQHDLSISLCVSDKFNVLCTRNPIIV